MEQINECFKCIELNKSLQAEKKKVSQKNRLITLLRELVRSYEAKDLNLTFTDLSRIYESSSSEVTILKQRLTLYLNENQELLQLKNEISSRNDLLEKKYRDVEDEISHLRFVNKQLGDYYREKEADHDQNKDRLKKLARKLLCYEPRNSEVRKILNLQNTPIDSDHKPLKHGKKKNEENAKDMKKDNIGNDGDDELIKMNSKPSDILNSEDLEMSDNSDCDNDTDCNETNNLLCIEEGTSPASPEPVIDSIKFNGMPNDLTSLSYDDKSSPEKPCEMNSKSGDRMVACEESDSSSNCVVSVDHSSFYKNISKESRTNVDENKISKSSEALPSIFEEESCSYEDLSEQSEVAANHKDSNDFLEFEGSLPDLISPLKSDEPRVLSYLDCMQILQQESVIQNNFEHDGSNQVVTRSDVNEKNEKVSADIKNECSSNSGDQIEKKKKSPPSMFQSKYQALNDSLLFSEKPMNGSHIPLNETYAPNYQFQSSHCFGCCNNSFDARPPVTLKLYNCSNVEISIPPSMQRNNLPIITVRDKCDLDKCFVNTPDDVNKLPDPPAVHSSSNTEKRDIRSNKDVCNQRIPSVLSCSRPSLNRSNHSIIESIKEPPNPYFQGFRDESKKPDYYFLDYLSKNQVSESNSSVKKQCLSESDCDAIKCSRMFPIKAGQKFDLGHFCYRFGSLSLKYSLPKQAFEVSNSEKINSTNKYSSLSNISQPPVFHNILKSSLSLNSKNEWIFGQKFLNATTKEDLCHKPNNLLSKATEGNSANKIKHGSIVQKSVLDIKTNYINVPVKNKIPSKQSVQNPFKKISDSNGFKETKDCFKPVTFDINNQMSERRQGIITQSCMNGPVENNLVPNEDINHETLKNNLVKLNSSHCNVRNPSNARLLDYSTETSKSEYNLASNDKGCSKSIFDFDQAKGVLSGNSNTHSTKCDNKTNPVVTPIQKPHTLTNSQCFPEKAEEQSIPQTERCLKENLQREKPVLQKERSPRKIKHSESPQAKNLLASHEYLFKKPDSVNVKAASDAKVAEKHLQLNPLLKKDMKVDFNERPNFNSPKKVDQLPKVMKKKSSPEIKIQNNKKNFPLQNGGLIKKEPKSLNNISLKPGNKRVADTLKNSINIGPDPVTDDEEKFDNELQEIFKEMEHITVPLLSPLRKTPEITAEETQRPKINEEDLEKKNRRIITKEGIESKDVEDVQINSSLEKPDINQEIIPKCDLINGRLKDKTINLQMQSIPTVDESKFKIFSDNDEIDSLEEETSMLTENGGVNDNSLEDMEIESCSKTKTNLDDNSTEVGNFTKTEEIKKYTRKRKKSTDTPYESKNFAPFPSSVECNSKISEEAIPATDSNCPSQDVETSVEDNKVELRSHTACDNKPSIGLGFYVNRSDVTDSTRHVSVSSLPEVEKLDCPTISDDPITDTYNTTSEEISFNDSCIPENCSVLPSVEAMQEGKEISLEKEESLGNKRKFGEINCQVEGMSSKKQKMFSDDEYISCECDVFICALRYLSAAAVASSDGKVCSLPKTNSDVNLTTKIAINHIKNLIIEALQSIDTNVYDVLNCSVKKIRQINDASPTSLAKAIIELIVESNDRSEAKDKPYMPNMTKTVKMCLLTAVSFIGYNRDFVMQFCEVFEQYISSFYDKSLRVAEGSQLVIFFTSFCRSYNLDDKVKYMIYDVLYTRNIKAYPMVYKAIQTWPDILPHSDTCNAKDCLLTQTIIFILLSGASAVELNEKLANLYCINNIRSYLFKYFGYKCNFIRREELTDKIIENICAKGCSVALVLLCKCEPWEWSLNVVEKKLLPILQSPRNMDEFTVCEYILTVGRVVRGFPITKAGYIVKNTLEVFERMLLESNSNHLSEIIIEAISLLRRHNLMKCTAILMNWKPNTKQITEKTINHISTILRVKNVGYWKNVYSAHSSNIIHNTRTFRKKRKSGFLSPA